ncbi:MAG TPA: hypothetical protein DHV92_07860 [Ruminococcaceae bacterium]|nr:hypothetical protein [Oscillospiraceae bacterium]
MLFRKRKQEEKPATKEVKSANTSAASNDSEKTDETDLDLGDMIKACDYYAGTENESFLVKLLADCLYDGSNGIAQDLDMAWSYYERLSNLDKAAGFLGMGKTDIMISLERNDSFRFSLGINRVYKAYKLGNQDAVEILAVTAESGMFENISTLEEMIKFCEECNDVKM